MKTRRPSYLIALGTLGFLMCLAGAASPFLLDKSCTIFTAVQADRVLYGNSEDQHNPDPVIGFFPPSQGGYGFVHFGVKDKDGRINFEGAANDQGLAWDCNSTPKFNLDSDPSKPYYLGSQNYLTAITKRDATVEETLRMTRRIDFGKTLAGQHHVADATGDALVISAGPDGELAFTRKAPGDGYHLSTNFNRAVPERGPVDFRWETARTMLGAMDTGSITWRKSHSGIPSVSMWASPMYFFTWAARCSPGGRRGCSAVLCGLLMPFCLSSARRRTSSPTDGQGQNLKRRMQPNGQ